VSSFNKLGPQRTDEGEEAPARFVRIGLAGAQESVQVSGKLGALCGREPLVIEKLCVILDAAAFAGSESTHGAIIAK